MEVNYVFGCCVNTLEMRENIQGAYYNSWNIV
jgi:hypothetical protein